MCFTHLFQQFIIHFFYVEIFQAFHQQLIFFIKGRDTITNRVLKLTIKNIHALDAVAINQSDS